MGCTGMHLNIQSLILQIIVRDIMDKLMQLVWLLKQTSAVSVLWSRRVQSW